MRLSALVALLAASTVAFAQPAATLPGSPGPDRLALPVLDNDALLARSEAARTRGVPAPLRFAEPVAVTVDAAQRTGWAPAADGGRIWRLVVDSPGAFSMSFGFEQFRLPAGANLWIYPEGGVPEYRPFTAADNEAHGQLWTPIVPGDRVVIQLDLPPTKAGVADDFALELGQVNHAFRPVLLTPSERAALGASRAKSGSCNVDVVCPEGDGYRDIIRSVGAYTVGGVDFCSGAAVNTTAGDERPLFLTADHCGITPGNQAAAVIYWNYQNSTCRTPGSAASGGPGDGSRSEFNSGTVELGDGENSDWSILEFDDPILASARVHLAGWDRRDVAPASAIAIHHPSVEEKRISFENDATSITTYSSNTPTASGTHIRVADWDLGTTEGGSSGSPLFDSNRRIVGQLHGGAAACGNDAPDWYGRMHRSMSDGLAAILDPGGTGAQTVDGIDYQPRAFANASVASGRIAPGETTRVTFTVGNPTASDVSSAQFTASIPTGMAFAGGLTSSQGTANGSANSVTWSGALPAGSDLVIAFDVSADASAADGTYALSSTTVIGGGQPDLTAAVEIDVFGTRPAPTLVAEVTPAAAIPDNSCSSGFATHTLDVTEDFVLARTSLGVNVTHTWRGDLRVQLTSPAGTTVEVLSRAGSGDFGTGDDNLDVVFDDAGPAGVLASGPHDPGAPFYDQDVAPESGTAGVGVGELASFVGERSAGTWTLGICDSAAQDTGTLNRWAVLLVESAPVSNETTAGTQALDVALVGANPVSAATGIRVTVPQPEAVRATLVDATGRTVGVLFDGVVAGTQDVSIDGARLSAGTYFVRVESASGRRTVPLAVVR